MDEVAHTQSNDGMLKNAARVNDEGEVRAGEASVAAGQRDGEEETRARRRPWAGKKRKSYSHAHFKVYKRRWFGLAQLVLLNVVVSWDVSRLYSYHGSAFYHDENEDEDLQQLPKFTRYLTLSIVAHIRPRVHLVSPLLLRLRNLHKLALNRLPLFLRRQQSPNNLPSPPGPQRQHPRRLATPVTRQLDPVCRHARLGRHIRARHVWADINGIGAAVCARGADAV
jgi:hypothetical protein